jgi:hypothetical protein
MVRVYPMRPHGGRGRTLLGWLRAYEGGELNLEPSCRAVSRAWSEEERSLLVDSVLRGWDVPKLYLLDFTYGVPALSEGRQPYAVVDGGRRLETFFAYFRDGFALSGTPPVPAPPRRIGSPETPVAEGPLGEGLDLSGMTYEDLMRREPAFAARLADYEPVVTSVVADSVGDLAEMMGRMGEPVRLPGTRMGRSTRRERSIR